MTVDKQRLYEDLLKISRQIGILSEEIPRLVTSREEMHYLKSHNIRFVRTGNDLIDKRTAGYGECSTFFKKGTKPFRNCFAIIKNEESFFRSNI